MGAHELALFRSHWRRRVRCRRRRLRGCGARAERSDSGVCAYACQRLPVVSAVIEHGAIKPAHFLAGTYLFDGSTSSERRRFVPA
jgi:hypothetical protein